MGKTDMKVGGEKNIQGHPLSFPPRLQNISVYSAAAHS